MKSPESQNLGRGEVADLMKLEACDSERVADRREQLQDLLPPAIDALHRSSKPDVVLPLHIRRELANDLVVGAWAPELKGPSGQIYVLLRHRLLQEAHGFEG